MISLVSFSFTSVLGHKWCILVWRRVSEFAPRLPLICYNVLSDQTPQLLCLCCSAYHLCWWLATPQTSWVDFLCCGWWQEVEDDPENKEEKVIKRKILLIWKQTKWLDACTCQLLTKNWSWVYKWQGDLLKNCIDTDHYQWCNSHLGDWNVLE